ncbi:MAG: PqqD family protein [Prevotella sp.]|nr:PqqD family protein [Prevotella sp.]MBO5204950.1 PqqD family protein [Prevotella sp.]MDO5526365.1 PqqD family protein [Prevotella sp.]
MKIKSGFKLHNICGENIIVAEGKENIDFSNVIHLNESATLLWNAVENIEFTEEMLADVLVKEYGIDRVTALVDATDIAKEWVKAGIVS